MSLPSNFNVSAVTEGLSPSVTAAGPSFASMVSGGVASTPIAPLGVTGTDSSFPIASLATGLNSATVTQSIQSLSSPSVVRDAQGRVTASNPLSKIDLGGGTVLTFDPTTLDAHMIPNLDPRSGSNNILYDDSGDSSFTASDCRIMVEVPQPPSFNGSQVQSRVAKQLLEASTLSVSIHRSKSPVRSFGYANPRGFARGSRTIAGTLVLSKSTAEVLYRFLQSGLVADLTKDTVYSKLDQLPPLDFTLLFSNEMGYASSQRLLGVEFVTDGTVVSVQDILLEQQITWMAADFTPLAPLNFNTFFGVNTTPSNATSVQRTPGSVISASNSPAYQVIPSSSQSGSGLGGSTIQGPGSSSVVNYVSPQVSN